MERRRSSRIAKLTEDVKEEVKEPKKVPAPKRAPKETAKPPAVAPNKRTRSAKQLVSEESAESGVQTKKKKKNEKENVPEEPMEEDDPSAEVSIVIPGASSVKQGVEPQPLPEQIGNKRRRSAAVTPALDPVPESKPEEQEEEEEVEDPFERPPSRIDRPRRSVASRRVSYVTPTPQIHDDNDEDRMISMSSSSSELSEDSEDDRQMSFSVKAENEKAKKMQNAALNSKKPVAQQKGKKPRKASSSESSEEPSGSDSEFEEESPEKKKGWRGRGGGGRSNGRKKPTGKEPDKGDINWPKCTKASIARKTGNPANSGNTKSGLRMVVKPKPEQPWRKNLANYEKDRKLAKGERRMKEYRIIAEAFAKGKTEEVSYDECYKVHEDMKRAYIEGRKLMDAIEKQEREEETGEKEDSSDDEWEEMEHFEPVIDDKIEVTLETEYDDGVEKDWWVVYLRQEVNKRIRELWENTHKLHLLCYMYHLNFTVKTALDESLVPSLMLSQLPSGYLKYVGETIPIDVMLKMVKWYGDAFRPLNGVMSVTAIEEGLKEGQEARYPATSRLTSLVTQKCFETDLDRAVLLFALLVGMECTARICVNVQAISRKWDKEQQEDLKRSMETFKEMSKSRSVTPKVEEVEEKEVVVKKKGGKAAKVEKKKKNKGEERNYWVEYWQPKEKRWICIDPLNKTVDEPLKIHEDASGPITYVFAIDNKRGICEVSRRYAMDCVKQEYRRRRTDPNWVSQTLRLPYFAANEERKKWEKMQMHEELVLRPLPTTMSEFKNHPLYVLEKDLLKFEAIYPPPEKQKPLGQIRGHNVYPRSCVYTLQGDNNWLKLARSVKIGEKAYKMVKARPDFRVPAEDRVDQFLEVFGYWQTEPYRRPKVKNGKIPRNDYGNVYMFHESMCPIGCVYLKLPGLIQIGRKLDKECVAAVVGWAFDGGWTHPVMDGAVVIEKDKDAFVKEWERLEAGKVQREEKKRADRVLENWKKLIKGMIRLNYVRNQFGVKNKLKNGPSTSNAKNEDSGNDDVEMEEEHHKIIDNSNAKKPLEGFSLDDFIKNKK